MLAGNIRIEGLNQTKQMLRRVKRAIENMRPALT